MNNEENLGYRFHSLQGEKLANIRWLFSRLWEVFENEGAMVCIQKSFIKLRSILWGDSSWLAFSPQRYDEQYKIWLKQHRLSSDSLQRMRRMAGQMLSPQRITVILMVRRIDEEGLRETIDSLRAQTYPHWDLVVIGEVSGQSILEHIVGAYSREDHRIQLKSVAGMECVADYVREQAAGEFVSFLSQDCYLSPEAIFSVVMHLRDFPDLDFVYSDEDTVREDSELADPFFKPSWSPDLLIGMNYVGHFNVVRKKSLVDIGADWGDIANDGLYHLVLRITEETNKIGRITKVLCHCHTEHERAEENFDTDRLRNQARVKSLQAALDRRGEQAEVVCDGTRELKVAFRVLGSPLVSIIIPTRDRWDMLRQCVESLEALTRYPSYEVIVVDNESRARKAREYLKVLSKRWSVHRFPGPFNFSEINNYGASKARGEFLLFLNDDTQVISPNWLSAMVAQAQRVGVGAVGAKLLYPTGRIQHAGVVLGIRGIAGHAFRHLQADVPHYHRLAHVMRNCSAVTAACMLISAKVFSGIGGFDCRLKVEYNDVDLCLRVTRAGYRIVYTPDAILIHHENASRKGGRSQEDETFFLARWAAKLQQGDPYYHPQLTLSREDWSIRV